MEWELKEVEHVDCTLDDSGIYTVINRTSKTEWSRGYSHTTVKIRVDILTTADNTPLISFIGDGNDVRKAVMKWLELGFRQRPDSISTEHASYIGYEISRAMSDVNYVQA